MSIAARPPVQRFNVEHYSADPLAPVLFYGGALSNFVGGPFEIAAPQPWTGSEVALHRALYSSTEHFFQASKADNQRQHDAVRAERNTWVAKRLGQRVSLRGGWEEWAGVYYMLVGLRHKFAVHGFAATLLGTGERYIAEDSPTDFKWGQRDAEGGWDGRNLLGVCLMIVRSELQRGESLDERDEIVSRYCADAADIRMFKQALRMPWFHTGRGRWWRSDG